VGDRRREPPQRGQLLRLHQGRLRAFEVCGALLHLTLEVEHEDVKVSLREAQGTRHVVEGGAQEPELALGVDPDLGVQLIACHAARSVQERLHRTHHAGMRERKEEHAEEQHAHGREQQGASPETADARVHRGEREAHVEQAEHVFVGPVSVAGGGVAALLVADGGDEPEDAVTSALEDPRALGQRDMASGRAVGVTGAARLCRVVEDRSDLSLGRGEGDAAVLGEEPHRLHALLLANLAHHVEGVAAPVLEHGAEGGPLDGVAEERGACRLAVQELFLHSPFGHGEHRHEDHADGGRDPEELGLEAVAPRNDAFDRG